MAVEKLWETMRESGMERKCDETGKTEIKGESDREDKERGRSSEMEQTNRDFRMTVNREQRRKWIIWKD